MQKHKSSKKFKTALLKSILVFGIFISPFAFAENPLVTQAKELQTGSEKVGIDHQKAIVLLKKAVDEGDAEAMYLLAYYYRIQPSYIANNDFMNHQLLSHSASLGNIDAIHELFTDYYSRVVSSFGIHPEYAKQIKKLTSEIQQKAKSDPEAMDTLAFIKENSKATPKEVCNQYFKAFQAGYEKSAMGLLQNCDKQNLQELKAPTQDQLKLIVQKYKQKELLNLRELEQRSHQNDIRTKLDFFSKQPYFFELNLSMGDAQKLEQEIISFYKRQASQGFSDAYLKLAKLDYENADKWLLKATQQNNPLAMFILARNYLSLTDDPDKHKLAISYLEQASKLGNPYAMNFLAVRILNQRDSISDMNHAIDLLKISANLGHTDSMEILSKILPDNENYEWAVKAYENDSTDLEVLHRAKKAFEKGIKVKKNLQQAKEITDYLKINENQQ